MPYDPDELNESAENPPETPDSATITEVRETTAGAVFPETVDLDDPTKRMIEVIAETDEADEESSVDITDSFSLPQSNTAWNNPNFKLGQFREQYGKVPEEGMSVSVQMNEENGILEIVY